MYTYTYTYYVYILYTHIIYTYSLYLFYSYIYIQSVHICLGESSLDRIHFIVLPNGVSDVMSREEIYAMRRVNDERNRDIVSFIYARYV